MLQEPHLSQGLPKAPPHPWCPPSSAHKPLQYGRPAQGGGGEAAASVSWSNLGTCERVPRGCEPGCRGSDAQPRRGASLGTLVQGVEGTQGESHGKGGGGARGPV